MSQPARVLTTLAVGAAAFLAAALVPGAASAEIGGTATTHRILGVVGSHQAAKQAASTNNLIYTGGTISAAPKVYVVFWGSQWGVAGANGLPTTDPSHEAPVLTSFLSKLYGAGDTWSTSTTQFCQGVPNGTTQCGTSGTHVGHPSSSPLGGVWVDTGSSPLTVPLDSQIAAEAARAAAHFNDYGTSTQYVVALPHNVIPIGYRAQYCAWHDNTTAAGHTIAYTNLPYIPDAGSSCGQGFVSPGSTGVDPTTEGVSIVEGHEYAETITDQWPSQTVAWTDSSGAENGDKCAWISSGQGASTILAINGQNFAVQSLWSNDFNGGQGGCVSRYVSATNQG